jgi:hypothetical protein
MRNILNGTAALISLPTRRNKHYFQRKHLTCRHLRCYMRHCSSLYHFFRIINRWRETYMRRNVARSLTNFTKSYASHRQTSEERMEVKLHYRIKWNRWKKVVVHSGADLPTFASSNLKTDWAPRVCLEVIICRRMQHMLGIEFTFSSLGYVKQRSVRWPRLKDEV